MFGHWLRHRHIERRKVGFMIGMVMAFGGGVSIGALADGRWGSASLAIAATGCVAAGGSIWLLPRWFTQT